MCGIAGFLNTLGNKCQNRVNIQSMVSALTHRGPDDEGIYVENGIALGHRRLSIVDLSHDGHQPMHSASGRYTMVFNGEIYNHKKLRKELQNKGIIFRGHSDSEVLLSLIDSLGLTEAIKQCVGMFAIALFDKKKKTLSLVRDRFGEKPLFYGWDSGNFIFASELKALQKYPGFRGSIDGDVVTLYLTFGYIPAPYSIYRGIYKLLPGTILTINLPIDGKTITKDNCCAETSVYWSNETVASYGIDNNFKGTYEDAVEQVNSLLMRAVEQQISADVPVGAFLSGGIDSSLITALMTQQSSHAVKTFTVGFREGGFNEGQYASAVANYLGTDHSEIVVESSDYFRLIPELPMLTDEPFSDTSLISTFLLAKLARKQVTVSLSGDGGDEIFYGYKQKYDFGYAFSSLPLRKLLGFCLGLLPFDMIERFAGRMSGGIAQKLSVAKLETLRGYLVSTDNISIAKRIASRIDVQEYLAHGTSELPTNFESNRNKKLRNNYPVMAMVLDRENYLPDDILVKVDRATMANSLESRAPLLDHRIVEFASCLPLSYLRTKSDGKRILRDVLYRHVPRNIVDRPKAGFSIPISRWLKTDLYEWAYDLLQDEKDNTFINVSGCQDIFEQHVRGERDMGRSLWSMLTFLSWSREKK